MAACEKCWADAFGRVQDHPMKSQAEHYQDLLEERKFNSCTPEQQKGNNMTKQNMNEGVPDCPECDGKGMCDEHKVEYLRYEYKKAMHEYEAELNRQAGKYKERIEQNNPEPKTERNQK